MPSLDWIGKKKVINHHLDVPYRILQPTEHFNTETESQNKIIKGDNLAALKSLLPEYEGKIKCIYIDPPYNTGNEQWVYNDNVNSPKIQKWLNTVVGKDGEDLTRHDKWLCMMYPRLKLLHRLLADDGAIFISIDDNEQAYLKLICDEIFGGSNFIASVCVVNNFKGRSDDKYIATAHENLLIYKKQSFQTNGVPLPEEYIKEYKEVDNQGKFRIQGLRKRGSGSKREDRPNMYYPFFYDKNSDELKLENTKETDIIIYPKLSDNSDGRWRWGKETAKIRIAELTCRIVKRRNEYDVFQKDYLIKEGQIKSIKPKSFWFGSEFSSEAGTLQVKSIIGKGKFNTPKSIDIIKYCLYQATNKNSIILDSFAGSGTTAHAVLNLNKEDGGNRKFILVEMEDYADTITAERVRRVIKGYGEGTKAVEGTGGDFTFYELGETMFIDKDFLNENLPLEEIRKYVYYTETGSTKTYQAQSAAVHIDYLGHHHNTDYYFHYKKGELTTLDTAFLNTITQKADGYVIYADVCGLSDDMMRTHNIVFKKIPRDITRL
jgi:adenine-specific DNA-methyltransferase